MHYWQNLENCRESLAGGWMECSSSWVEKWGKQSDLLLKNCIFGARKAMPKNAKINQSTMQLWDCFLCSFFYSISLFPSCFLNYSTSTVFVSLPIFTFIFFITFIPNSPVNSSFTLFLGLDHHGVFPSLCGGKLDEWHQSL